MGLRDPIPLQDHLCIGRSLECSAHPLHNGRALPLLHGAACAPLLSAQRFGQLHAQHRRCSARSSGRRQTAASGRCGKHKTACFPL